MGHTREGGIAWPLRAVGRIRCCSGKVRSLMFFGGSPNNTILGNLGYCIRNEVVCRSNPSGSFFDVLWRVPKVKGLHSSRGRSNSQHLGIPLTGSSNVTTALLGTLRNPQGALRQCTRSQETMVFGWVARTPSQKNMSILEAKRWGSFSQSI